MKKLFSFIAVICFATTVSAQYQVENSDFEKFLTNGEPNRWHGFKSATGGLEGMAKGELFSSSDVRPNSLGSKSAVIKSGVTTILFTSIVNNGTFTTGRLKAASTSASNSANHAEMDKTSTATDNNGDKFYMPLTGHPDVMKVWIKFSQGTTNSSHPYASANAVLFDGNYYQDPEDKTYTNVVAKATNKTIATCGWTEFSIPFAYTSNNVEPAAILITFGTNADPGQGSNGDQVWIDDLELIYNHDLASVVYDGTNVAVASAMDLSDQYYDESKLVLTHNAKGNATIEKSYDAATGLLSITVYGEDYGTDTETLFQNPNSKSTYTIQFMPDKYDLLTLSYDGQTIPFVADNEVDVLIDAPYNAEKLAYTYSNGATISVDDLDENRHVYIEVTSGTGSGECKGYDINFLYRGDVNNDGDVTIADVTSLVNIILGKSTEYKRSVADVNGDNDVSIADVTALVNIILGKN